jgi:hypothetical protein
MFRRQWKRDWLKSSAMVSSARRPVRCSWERWGYDAGREIKARKRHIVIDTQGLLTTIVYSAAIQDRVAALPVLTRLFCRFDTIPTVFVDAVYKPRFGGVFFAGVSNRFCSLRFSISSGESKSGE